ncbi:cation diffusion facilitator family transporter [Dyadobacter psychrotolerans]|uniref:Cation transporter n=1 Tax=Dyadobacter psychrotolerans TaxID=2541721 RepID=A0A4V2Z415_9BACT|nr:cation diffusion facilitator family transporter [Dyadobacter psychrotolerans]TDE14838.1 cation transporter [Dyadobacter psychrotolerans]
MAKNNKSIYSALIANVLIAVTKFAAGAYSNSSSMISEGIHSLVDTVNQLLLLYGLKRSKKPADALRPFGYGKELYFWSFIVSILIFGLGGGISIFQGILHIIEPEALGDPTWNYAVIGMSILLEGWSLFVAIKEFDKVRNGLSWWNAIVKSKDPSSFLVLFEDGAAVLGLLIVFVFMIIGHHFQIVYLDGIASVMIGLLLVFVSAILARESRSLLMGEGIAPETQEKIRALAEQDQAVLKVLSMMSTYQSPTEVLLMLIVVFKADIDTEDITDSIERIRKSVKDAFPLIRFVIIQPQTVEGN